MVNTVGDGEVGTAMVRRRPASGLPRWATDEGVKDLTDEPVAITRGRYMWQTDCARRLGLSTAQLDDLLYRPRVTRRDSPLSAISRPAAHFRGDPLYSPKQCELFLKLADDAPSKLVSSNDKLPTVTRAEAGERGLLTDPEIAARHGFARSSIARFAATIETFPPFVAKQSTEGRRGHPHKLRDGGAVDAWFRARTEQHQEAV